jgi:hypothetical protein
VGWSLLAKELPSKHVIEGKIEGKIELTGRRGTRRRQILDDSENKKGYWKLWRTRFAGVNYGPLVTE